MCGYPDVILSKRVKLSKMCLAVVKKLPLSLTTLPYKIHFYTKSNMRTICSFLCQKLETLLSWYLLTNWMCMQAQKMSGFLKIWIDLIVATPCSHLTLIFDVFLDRLIHDEQMPGWWSSTVRELVDIARAGTQWALLACFCVLPRTFDSSCRWVFVWHTWFLER